MTGGPYNWKKSRRITMTRQMGGWWRVWIVVSILWFAFTMFEVMFVKGDWRTQEQHRSSAISIFCPSWAEKAGDDVLTHIANNDFSSYPAPPPDWKLEPPSEETRTAARKCLEVRHADYSAEVRDQTIASLLIALLFGVTPPLLVLAAAWVLRWVLRGFRKQG
jgi:hypothetical protein